MTKQAVSRRGVRPRVSLTNLSRRTVDVPSNRHTKNSELLVSV